ncbi:MAG: histidine phosphatase family protein [Fimbriimonadaceae bacterium]|nr:histidine phosphatase family protein [Fimbriimonadaceae bacterium]QYK55700.1 MAG: histidine phosphatase family protein [Fimbriimonadaceae bacterium]
MRVVLVRHGQTDWNKEGRAQGHADIELNAEGHLQARALARHLHGQSFSRVLSSDLTRCRQTLTPWLELSGAQVEFREDLRERTFGELEGADYVTVRKWLQEEAKRLGCADYEVTPPGGESMHTVWRRLSNVAELLSQEPGDTLVVSHGGSIAQLLSRLVRGTPETARSFRFSNTGVTTLWRRADGYFALEGYDETGHLEAYLEDPALA